MLANQVLVDFTVATRGTDNHIQSVISGQKKSKWLDTFPTKTVPVPLYIEDHEQIEAVHSHLTSVLDSTPTHIYSDRIKFTMDVLFPESIICALAFVGNLCILEAEETFLHGPVIDMSEREHFDRKSDEELKRSGIP